MTSAHRGFTDPTILWKWMETYEEDTGGKLLAILYNGNLSNGEMSAFKKLGMMEREYA